MNLFLAECAKALHGRVPLKEAQERMAVVNEALTWQSTPYHNHGRVKGAGVDCGTILIEVFSKVGLIKDFDPGDYSPDWHMHRSEELYLNIVERFARKVESRTLAQALPGDVVLFKYGRTISHGGIMLSGPLMIHSYLGRGVGIDDVGMGEFPERFVGLWSIWECV